MNEFEYLGLKITAWGNIKEKIFEKICRDLANRNDTPVGYTYESFYEAAKKVNMHKYDIFKINGEKAPRIPGANYLFHYQGKIKEI